MRLLVLGGTKFLGRGVVEAALARGHEVTLFHRGRTNPGLFPEAEHLIGDRDGGLEPLRGRRWDAVVDPSGYVPRVVGAAADRLRDAVGHYTFVSSISVYARFDRPGLDEAAPVHTLEDPASEDVQAHYGALKVACEQAVAARFPGRSASIRAGLIVGPHDPSGRFPWWVDRVARGGELVAPAPPERPVQCVDARDLGAWMVRVAEQRTAGVFNATGPAAPLAFATWIETLRAVAGSDARAVWVPEATLLAHGVTPWTDLPLWSPLGHPDFAHIHAVDVSRAVAAGLTCRPMVETARDTLAWIRERGDFPMEMGPVGLSPEVEARVLAAARRG